MTAIINTDQIFREDRENPPTERTLPWEETRDGLTVVVEPKPHWAEDMRVFRLDAREHCRYAEWTAHGGRTRFYGHIAHRRQRNRGRPRSERKSAGRSAVTG